MGIPIYPSKARGWEFSEYKSKIIEYPNEQACDDDKGGRVWKESTDWTPYGDDHVNSDLAMYVDDYGRSDGSWYKWTWEWTGKTQRGIPKDHIYMTMHY